MNKVYYYCPRKLSNSFFDIQKNIIKKIGYELIDINYSNYEQELIENKPINSIIILNFVENGYSLGKNLFAFYLSWHKIFHVCKKNNNKFVFVYHNLSSHDGKLFKKLLTKLVICFLKKYSDAIQLLSNGSLQYIKDSYKNKCFIIPHSNYIDAYGPIKDSIDNDYLNLLFFGMIKKYKNIEVIIEVAKTLKNKKIVFTIRGDANTEYYKKLIKISKNLDNVIIVPKFVENDKVPEIISKCDAIILPYKKESCLNSGAVVLAGSYQKTIICPLIATIKDLPRDLVYSYDYSNKKSHINNLRNAIIKMYNDKNADPNVLKEKGQQLMNYLSNNHSDKIVAENYKKMFNYLNNKDN